MANPPVWGNPTSTLVKLLLWSILVGYILSLWEWKPLDVPKHIWYFSLDLYHWVLTSFDEFFEMFLVGAMIVVPVFIIRQIFRKRKNDGS